jgi:hypothetical protein
MREYQVEDSTSVLGFNHTDRFQGGSVPNVDLRVFTSFSSCNFCSFLLVLSQLSYLKGEQQYKLSYSNVSGKISTSCQPDPRLYQFLIQNRRIPSNYPTSY